MGKIYVNQTALDIEATTGVDVTGAISLLIKYEKPDGVTTGSFEAIATDEANGVIQYSVTSSEDIDQSGLWCFWAYVVFADGSYAAGEVYRERIYIEGIA
jgi:hypothetical protein